MTGSALANPGDPVCGHVLEHEGESWACQFPPRHDLADMHAAWAVDGEGGAWWTHEACSPVCAAVGISAAVLASGHPDSRDRPPAARTAPPAHDPAITHDHRNEAP